ncbi:hypothetical protein V1512DRAFT_260356 [Lipomyces arxii]|uniref:uncharacterized protein n=1 Tax=Lipomyces arxii TaxID=56418 RepID=UPI0034CFBB1D
MPPTEDNSYLGSTLPLCEHDFFRRKSLLCHVCGGALRGDYVMAVGHKYHLEHFTCSVCPRVFRKDDNYYERDGSVYCHFHFSTLFADRCEGCHSAILKQFVENFKNGRHEHWHPECYMINKYWHAQLGDRSNKLSSAVTDPGPLVWKEESDLTPELLMKRQKDLEDQVYRIWNVLSNFEEVSATCVSDMLQHATRGYAMNAVVATSRLIYRIQILFTAIDDLRQFNVQGLHSLGREPKTLCKAVVNFLTALPGGLTFSPARVIASKDLLHLVTSMAHYLKLLVQFGLSTALAIDRLDSQTLVVKKFLDYLALNDTAPLLSQLNLVPGITDQCMACNHGIENKCTRLAAKNADDKRERRWHLTAECFSCSKCARSLINEVAGAAWIESSSSILCSQCVASETDAYYGFLFVSRLTQYSFLLKVALQRVYKTVSDAKPASAAKSTGENDRTDMPDTYINTLTDIRRLHSTRFRRALSDAKRHHHVLKSKGDRQDPSLSPRSDDFRRHKSSRRQKSSPPPAFPLQRRRSHKKADGSPSSLSSTAQPSQDALNRLTPKSRSLASSQAASPASSPSPRSPDCSSAPKHTDLMLTEKYLTLDDIPRIVAVEEAREQRPNAFRHQRQSSLVLGVGVAPKLMNANGAHVDGNRNSIGRMRSVASSSNSAAATAATSDHSKEVFFADLTLKDHARVREAAINALRPIMASYISVEEFNDATSGPNPDLAGASGSGKLGFWEKFGRAFSKGSSSGGSSPSSSPGVASVSHSPTKLNRKKTNASSVPTGVFKVPLDVLVERSGTESELGDSEGTVHVPSFLDDVIGAMKRKDMSVEGVFRKNGNIRKLRELSEQIDMSIASASKVNYDTESPVQLAALLKKFLRELPDPLLTFKLYKIWVASQRISNDETRVRVLHLCCCLLPRAHRSSMEILLNFLKWVASFSHVDDESGSKMDVHNLSTVITPNILFSPTDHLVDDLAVATANSGPELADETLAGSPAELMDDSYFLAIEAVNTLIDGHDIFSVVPEGIMEFIDANTTDSKPPTGNDVTPTR